VKQIAVLRHWTALKGRSLSFVTVPKLCIEIKNV